MSGSLFLYITKKGEIVKIPKPSYSDYKAVPSLANHEVLLTTLIYKTLNRKPQELEFVSFHRDILDSNGTLKINVDDIKKYMIYFESPESLAERECPVPLPTAPNNVPTTIEKNALYSYIKGRYPNLWPNCPYLVEQQIRNVEDIYIKHKDFVKKVYKIKNTKD